MVEEADHTNSSDRPTTLWRRTRDHRIAQWTVGYVALAYGIQHGVTLTTDAFDWPHAVTRVSMLLLALGLPVAMTLAWYHGDRANRRISGAELSILSAILAGVAIMFYVFVRPDDVATSPTGRQASVFSTPMATANGIAIAVLPFANVSGDPGQEFFSDGMTDEIMTALAKVKGLTVLARTSAFAYKGQNQNIRDIGQALGATYLVEGSVRKAGDQVRITAQLVRADNGASLWTDSYDRELKNIFATQSDIAQAIAASLRVPLGLKPGESLVANRTGNLESYEEYLHARSLYRAQSYNEARDVLERVVAHDPEFAPAWAMLSLAYTFSPRGEGVTERGDVQEARRVVQAFQAKADMAGRRAVQLDARNSTGYGALAAVAFDRGRWAEAEDLFQQAVAIDPNDPEVLNSYVSMLMSSGRINQSLKGREKLQSLEPLVPLYRMRYASVFLQTGQPARAASLIESVPAEPGVIYFRNAALAEAYADNGRFAEAAKTLLDITSDRASRQSVEDAARLVRQAPTKIPAERLPVLEGPLAFVYYYVGAPEKILDQPERRFEIGFRNFDQSVWGPKYAAVRKTDRFKTYARKAGLVEYWRARGWPDLCHPTTGDDFECN